MSEICQSPDSITNNNTPVPDWSELNSNDMSSYLFEVPKHSISPIFLPNFFGSSWLKLSVESNVNAEPDA